jgi:hypothetical protein
MTFPYYKGNESAEMEELVSEIHRKMTWADAFYDLNSLKVEKKNKKKSVVQPHAYSLASRYYPFR